MLLKLLSVFVILVVKTSGQLSPLSPCPGVFHYETDGMQWFGVMNVPSPQMGVLIKLNLKMSIKTRLPTKYVGRIELLGKRTEILKQILAGGKLQYRVFFPLLTILPKVTEININQKRICVGPPADGQIVTSINLSHSISTANYMQNDNSRLTESNNDFNYYRPAENPTESPYEKPNPDNFASTRRSTKHNKNKIDVYRPVSEESASSFTCGKIRTSANALIVGGDATSKGDWPWLVAMFVKKESGLNFICSGSLISNKHVVTAAHCVHKKNNRPVKVEEVVLKLGVFNLQDWTDKNSKIIEVNDVMLHPSFKGGLVLESDIAVIEFNPVEFTEYIIPVCLWDGNIDLSQVVGKKATVVGWGRDENGLAVTPEPRLAVIPIVSTATCRSSRVEFIYLTSENTLCAGSKNGVGPCNGDSGGGLFLMENGQWYIRGVVSASLKDAETQSCDLNEYVVFTDVAKFASWIRNLPK